MHNLIYWPISQNTYHWLLALHIIAIICWFAGLFYLPRLFVYHAMSQDNTTQKTFCIMEHKLNYYIMIPSMLVTILSGLLLMHFYFINHQIISTWLLIKLALVICLIAYQFSCTHYVKVFKAKTNSHSHRFYRIFNELPTLLLLVIVVLAVVKPFSGGWLGFSV